LTVEYIAWSLPLWEEIPAMEKAPYIPDKPGLGLSFNRDVINRYGVADIQYPTAKLSFKALMR
jgi:hypothetical protein